MRQNDRQCCVRHIWVYTCGVICLTSASRPTTLDDLLDECPQMHKIVSAQPRAARRAPGECVGFADVGPGRKQRAQPALSVEEHHPILAPVQLASGKDEALAPPRVERMR